MHKREFLSLIGSLSFASKVVKPGRMFLWTYRRLCPACISILHLIVKLVQTSYGGASSSPPGMALR